MDWTKKIPEDLWKIIVHAHQAGKSYKTISKKFGLHNSTVNISISLRRSGQPTKTISRPRYVILQGVLKNISKPNSNKASSYFVFLNPLNSANHFGEGEQYYLVDLKNTTD